MVQLVCLILSAIFAALAATGVPSHPHFQWLPASVLFLSLSFLLVASAR